MKFSDFLDRYYLSPSFPSVFSTGWMIRKNTRPGQKQFRCWVFYLHLRWLCLLFSIDIINIKVYSSINVQYWLIAILYFFNSHGRRFLFFFLPWLKNMLLNINFQIHLKNIAGNQVGLSLNFAVFSLCRWYVINKFCNFITTWNVSVKNQPNQILKRIQSYCYLSPSKL